jgi:hypothetical protein
MCEVIRNQIHHPFRILDLLAEDKVWLGFSKGNDFVRFDTLHAYIADHHGPPACQGGRSPVQPTP